MPQLCMLAAMQSGSQLMTIFSAADSIHQRRLPPSIAQVMLYDSSWIQRPSSWRVSYPLPVSSPWAASEKKG